MRIKVVKAFDGFVKGTEFDMDEKCRAFKERVAPALAAGNAKAVVDDAPKAPPK